VTKRINVQSRVPSQSTSLLRRAATQQTLLSSELRVEDGAARGSHDGVVGHDDELDVKQGVVIPYATDDCRVAVA
jgi:hypothetical protein